MRRMYLRLPFGLVVLFLVGGFALGQSPTGAPTPAAGQFVVTREPVKDGSRATADLPNSLHKRNTGGSDGYGLCVPTSAWHSALWQSVSDIYGFRDWLTRYPGGSYPEKFEQTLNAFCKERGISAPGYVQHTGGDEEFLRLALKTGRMPCITYCGVDGPGRYGQDVIAHMVNLLYLDDQLACVLDNNFPGTFIWMSRADLIARWRGIQTDGRPYLARDDRGRLRPVGGGWAIAFLGSPPPPYPAQPAAQMQFGAAAKDACGYCGESCACKPGDCPAKCPVLVGQDCRNGKCYVPSSSQPTPATVPVPLADWQGEWISSDSGEWGFWRNGKRIAAAFPDGRVEGCNAYGIANGVAILPPAPLPPGVVTRVPEQMPAAIGAGQFPQGGVMPDRLTTEKTWRVNGESSTKEMVFAALATLTDDSDRWHLAIVGEPTFARKVRDDLGALPLSVRAKLHVQSYTPESWQAAQFKLPVGVTLRKPAAGRVSGDVGTVPLADYSPAKLDALLTSAEGPTPKPVAPSPKPIEPDAPKVEPAPQPKPEPKPFGEAGGGWVLVVLGILAAVFVLKK